MTDLAGRLSHRLQLTTDGHRPYLSAVEDAFGMGIDYAMLQKICGTDPENEAATAPRSASAARWTWCRALLTGSKFRPATWSARTGPCVPRCAATRAVERL